jgi:poly-gamma-glutamate synthesis protein (capsule biosynthesis protein)
MKVLLFCTLLGACSPARLHAQPGGTNAPVTMRFGGDCLLAGFYESAAADSPAIAFAGFDLFRNDDFSLVNLESCITLRGEAVPKPYNFRTHPRFVTMLRQAGIDLVNIANNHVFDYGPDGLFDTIEALDSLGLPHIGAGRSEREAHTPYVATLGGKRFAFFGYYHGTEAPPARSDSPGVAQRSLRLIKRDIHSARKELKADHVIVTLHWGKEKSETPEPWQRRFARAVIDAGAEAVIGHHPHVFQGIERYRGGLIAYSLGNLIFGGNSRDSYDTALLELRWTTGGMAYDVLPVRVTGYRAAPLEGPEGEQVIKHVQSLSRILHETTSHRKEHE